jgi:hypothetical protein
MAKKEERKRGYGAVLFIILLLITIAFLVWLLLRPKSDATRTPTGNIDIYNININCVCGPEKKDDDDCDDEIVSYSGTVNGRRGTNIRDHGVVYVDDKNGWYDYQKSIHIFESPAFEYTETIAPGVSNSYDFQVHNTTLTAIKYNVQFEEDSEYAINMRYRLKLNNNYVVGNDSTWVTAAELESGLTYLPGDATDTFTLDWEWPYEGGTDEADTLAGEEMMSKYSLGVKIGFEEA